MLADALQKQLSEKEIPDSFSMHIFRVLYKSNSLIYIAYLTCVAEFSLALSTRSRRGGSYSRSATEFVRVVDQLLPVKVFYRICPELQNASRT